MIAIRREEEKASIAKRVKACEHGELLQTRTKTVVDTNSPSTRIPFACEMPEAIRWKFLNGGQDDR